MILIVHVLAGAAIFNFAPNPVLGLIFAFLSHYFLDAMPHKDYSINNIKNGFWKKSSPDFSKAFLDIIFGFSVIFLMTGGDITVLVAGGLAIIPDGFTLLYCIFPANKLLIGHKKIHDLINNIGENKKIPVFLRITGPIVISLFAIFLLK